MPAQLVDTCEYLRQQARFVNRLLERYLPAEYAEPKSLHAAMRYSVMAGGKRLRPILALAAYDYCGGRLKGESTPICLAAAALEMVHTYSLIHDDLPCMDDDDLRRGLPTCHKKFGEAVAVLAGDALHDLAFSLIARTGCVNAVLELADAIGTEGMIGGQIADVEAEGRDVTRDDVVNIHRRKTAALMKCSVRLGAVLAGADEATLLRLSRYGEALGLAFQIIDDVLDIEGDRTLLGKNTGSDGKKLKATYPRAVGLEKARADAAELIDEALALFEAGDDNMLKQLALYVGQRQS